MATTTSTPFTANPAPLSTGGVRTDEPTLLIKALLVTLPITSFLAIPVVQGSTPANLLAMLALFPLTGLLLLPLQGYSELMRRLALWLGVIVMLFLLSRLNHINGLVLGMDKLYNINERTALPYVPISNLTQTLYLVAGLVVFKLTASLYRVSWDRWILAGAWFLVLYGFIDWSAESFAGLNFDFLSNRTFKESEMFDTPGSLRQHLPVMGWQMMRFKSVTGEASMYAITALPYLYLAIVRGKRALAGLLVLSLLLTMSTVAYTGLIALMAFLALRVKLPLKPGHYLLLLLGLCFVVVLTFFNFEGLSHIIERTFVHKLSGTDESGAARGSYFRTNVNFWMAPSTSWMVQLFGVGFGTIRSTDLFSTLLVNIGLLGCLLVAAWAVWVFSQAWATGKRLGAAVFGTLFLLMLAAVPEFAYLPPWLLVGLLQSPVFKESIA